MQARMPVGRPGRYAHFEQLKNSLSSSMKRARYVHNIGLCKGARNISVYVKIHLRNGGTFNGKSYNSGDYAEIKLGSLTSFTWQQIIDRRDELQGRADRAEPLEERCSPRFDAFADEYFQHFSARAKDLKTARFYIEKQLKPYFERLALDAITPSHIVSFLTKLKTTDHYSDNTVRRCYNVLRAIFSFAVQVNALTVSPCTRVPVPRIQTTRERFLSNDEMMLVLAEASNMQPWLYDYIVWALHSGMRKVEIVNLKWEQFIVLNEVGYVRLISDKTGKSRMIRCTPSMLEILTSRRADNPESSRVFDISETSLRRAWKTLKERVDVNDIWIYDLRRTHATHVAASVPDLNVLARRLGHSDLTMLQRHYAVVMESSDSDLTNSIETIFNRERQNG